MAKSCIYAKSTVTSITSGSETTCTLFINQYGTEKTMQLLCFLVAACLLALLMSCEGFSLVEKSGCSRAPAQRVFMSTFNDEPTRVARLKQSLVTTNEILTSIETKIDNLSKDTKKMFDALDHKHDTQFDALDKTIDTMFDKLDKKLDTKFDTTFDKLDQIVSKLDTFSNSTNDKLNNQKFWLVALSASGGLMTIVGGILTMKDATGWFHK